ncbi:MAG: IS630 family transposase [Candidatus Zixiibacteriota bacterium]
MHSYRDNFPLLDEATKKSVFGAQGTRSRLWERSAIATLNLSGIDARTIAWFVERRPRTVQRWLQRIEAGHDLYDDKRSGRPPIYTEDFYLKTIAFYCARSPLPGCTGWSFRDAETYLECNPAELGASPSHATLQRILTTHALRPHLREYFLQITDPDFFPKADAIIALYLDPPEYLHCFDECTCIQALRRLSPDIPAGNGRPALIDYDYERNGVRDLMAFLRPATGNVFGQCTLNHKTETLCQVFTNHVLSLPLEVQLDYMMDNLNTHFSYDFCQTVARLSGESCPPLKSLETGKQRREWLESNDKRIVIHFLPTHASWLNMIEIWFGIFKSKCLDRASFTSVQELREAIEAFLQTWNDFFAHPFNWGYTGAGLQAKAVRRFCKLLLIEAKDMDAKFLTSQLLLMSNIAQSYLELVPQENWMNLMELAREKSDYITRIITTDTKERRRNKAMAALAQFHQSLRQVL